ncbi:IS91 family transposase [Chondrinema litorale]|uniref:IS91 family transposase n=1 Tax=Chondrinema litorale TaxID=2994555 RepID=UPI00254334DF|nr:IS91 family transposase [Chondrinema litorale]UZR99029.1 IS91 family transposase [Chondrinema litorale]
MSTVSENVNRRQGLELSDIFRRYGEDFLSSHMLCPDQLKAYRAIRDCRTVAMGGHVEGCDHCTYHRNAYNSCRNRHCNKCQYAKQLQWVDKLQANLPVCSYFHVVFTIPQSLHKLFYINQRVCYDLLMKSSWQAVKNVTANPRYLGARTGAVSVLHTWGQSLTYHPHVHLLVPAGGITDDGMEWKDAKDYLASVKVLSKVFRGIFWEWICKYLSKEKIKLSDDLIDKVDLKKKIYEKNWNVYAKRPLASPRSVVGYLSKYTHRVAICNSRLLAMGNGKVTFRWKDYRKSSRQDWMTLEANEFIARFMRHILPKGFYKVRYYGLLSPVNKKLKDMCAELMGRSEIISLLAGLTAKEVFRVVTGKDPDICPKCKKGKMMVRLHIDPG